MARFFLIMMILFATGCDNNSGMMNEIERIDDKTIATLKEKKIFFGHQSVGHNIIDGIKDLKTGIYIQELESGQELTKPGIYHAKMGNNSFPRSKVDAFTNRLRENDLGKKLDIAFLKFCYVDFDKDSNVSDIFNYYAEAIESLKKEYANLKVVHVTVPLTIHTNGIKSFIKNFLVGDIPNVKRNEFNILLKKKYQGKAPIYDLAAIESTYPDGKREGFKYQGSEYYALIKEYTYDGGHLNKIGSYLAARELLKVLSGL